METIFQLSNLLVMPFWLLMILAPHWRWTKRIMASLWSITPAALLYAVLVVPKMAGLIGLLANPEPGPIAALLGSLEGATIAWIHFVAFDLFVGRWVYLDSREHGFTAWLVSPMLFFVLMFGPFGLLLYLGLRAVMLRNTARFAANPIS